MEKYSSWLKSTSSDISWHNALYRFAAEKPFCHTNEKIIDDTLEILNTNCQDTINVLGIKDTEISRAIFSLLRPGNSWQIDDGDRISILTPQGIEDFENVWHPEYIKYCEQVYNHLIKIPLGIIGVQKRKDYLSPVLPNRVKLLSDLGLSSLAQGYDAVVRNAISHGGVEYHVGDIRYIDAKEQKDLPVWDLIKLLDDLVDTCNSIIVALLIFIIENQAAIEKHGINVLPLGLRFFLVEGFTARYGIRIVSFEESGHNNSQLNINLMTDTTSREVQQFEALFITWAACYFGGAKYDRFLVSIDCKMPIQPLLTIRGNSLRDGIQKNQLFSDVAPKLFESALLWYDTTSLSSRLYMLATSFKIHWEIQKRKIQMDLLQKGIFLPNLGYKIVFYKNTSPSSFRRIEGHAVLNITGKITDQELIKIIRSAINQLKRKLIRRKDIFGERGLPGSPYSINLRLYSVDRRIRTLSSYTWSNEELVCIAEFSKNWKKSPPFYTREADRIVGSIRIKYNPKLMKTA